MTIIMSVTMFEDMPRPYVQFTSSPPGPKSQTRVLSGVNGTIITNQIASSIAVATITEIFLALGCNVKKSFNDIIVGFELNAYINLTNQPQEP